MAIKHPFVSGKADGVDGSRVRPSNWDADHTIEAGTFLDTHVSPSAAIAWSKISKVGAVAADVGASALGHNHVGVYDPIGTASGLISTHESTYTHANIAHGETAYGWGNHASAGYAVATTYTGSTSIVTLGTITTGTFPWGNLSGVPGTFTPSSHTIESHTATVTAGQFLKGTGVNTFGWAAHGLTYSDVGAQQSNTNLTSLAGLTFVSTSFVKMTAAGTFGLDTGTYSLSSHDHSGVYDPAGTAASAVSTHASLITGVHGLVFTAGKSLTLTESLTLNTLPVGGLAVATSANTLGSLAVGLTTQILVGGGLATVPAWTTDIPTAVTIGSGYIYRAGGTDVPVSDGGTGVSTFALNGILYGNATNAIGVTAIGAEGQILRVGASPFVPAWTTSTFANTYIKGDLLHASAVNVVTGLADVAAGKPLLSGGVELAPAYAGYTFSGTADQTYTFPSATSTLQSTTGTPAGFVIASQAIGDLLYASTATAWARLADVAVGAYLRSGGVATVPLWSTLILPNAGTIYKLPVFSAANTMTELAAVGSTGEYLAGATGAIPTWATLNQASVAGLRTTDTPTLQGLYLDCPTASDLLFLTSGVAKWDFNKDGANNFAIYSYGFGDNVLYLKYSTGNVGIATGLPGAGVTYQRLNINGSQLFVGADSTQESPMFQIVPSYVVNTHASYTSRTILSQWAIGGAQEVMRFESGAAAMVGVLGHVAQALPAAYTQTYATTTRTHSVITAVDPATYGAGTNGYSTEAMAATVHAEVIALRADMENVKSVLNQVIDDFQGYGWLQ